VVNIENSIQRQSLNISENIESYLFKQFCDNFTRLKDELKDTLNYPLARYKHLTIQLKEYQEVVSSYNKFISSSEEIISKYHNLTERSEKAKLYREGLLPLLNTLFDSSGYFFKLSNYCHLAAKQISEHAEVVSITFGLNKPVKNTIENYEHIKFSNMIKSTNEDIRRVENYFDMLRYHNSSIMPNNANLKESFHAENISATLRFYFPNLNLEVHNDCEVQSNKGDFFYILFQIAEIVSEHTKKIKNYISQYIFDFIINEDNELFPEIKDNLEHLTRDPIVDIFIDKDSNQVTARYSSKNICLQIAQAEVSNNIEILEGPLKSYLKLQNGTYLLQIQDDILDVKVASPNIKLLKTYQVEALPRDFMNSHNSFEIDIETSYFGLTSRNLKIVLPCDFYIDENVRRRICKSFYKLDKFVDTFHNYNYLDLSNWFLSDQPEFEYGYIQIGDEIPKIKICTSLLDDDETLHQLKELNKIANIRSLNLDYSPNLITSSSDLINFASEVLTEISTEVEKLRREKRIEKREDIEIENELSLSFFAPNRFNSIKINLFGATHRILNY
jgi:hypothetical protein